jgi:hypothetical protein
MIIHDDWLVKGKKPYFVSREKKEDWHKKLVLLVQKISENNLFPKPENLTILTCHNYNYETLLETNLNSLGIDYVLLQPENINDEWINTNKLLLYYEYVRDKCDTEYVMSLDSDDICFVDSPQMAIDALLHYNCDLLFNSTGAGRNYDSMSSRKVLIDTIRYVVGNSNTFSQRLYLNAGAWIGKTSKIIDIMKNAVSYIDNTVWSKGYKEYERLRKMEIDFNDYGFTKYPYGSPSDQDIFRWIEPDYYPRIQIDYMHKFSIRGNIPVIDWIIKQEITNGSDN